LVTDFYEYGWGESFHFPPRFPFETFHEAIRRHEYYLSNRLGLNSTMKCVDLGCGVGGPMRAIARFSGAKIVGVNNNDYQIKVGTKYVQRDGLGHVASFQKADFNNLPLEPNSFDAAYAIEATCHSPDKVKTFVEVLRVLKPGGLFTGYDWVMTDKYDAKNATHRAIKQGIEVGNSLPVLPFGEDVVDALKKAGFEVIDHFDKGYRAPFEPAQIPWHDSLKGRFTLEGFRMTGLGRFCTHILVNTLEALRIAPKGSAKVSSLLNATANDLVAAGELGIFTPAFFFLARKPLRQ